jgi:ABC-type transporter Mla subunit MlaD
MEQEIMQQLMGSAEKLAGAAEALERALARLDEQHAALDAKVERIVAAIEEKVPEEGLKELVAEVERANADLKAQAGRAARKTLPPLVATLLGKNYSAEEGIEAEKLDKALSSLSVEQRIAVKAEMARAGII